LALGACGVKQEAVVGTPRTKPFTVVLDRPTNATDAPLIAAMADGAFRAGGLAVSLQPPPTPSAPLRMLTEGRVDVAITSEPELLLARDHGNALVSIAAMVQQPLAALIALPRGGVASVAGLAGKRVGTGGTDGQAALLGAMLVHAGIGIGSVRQVPVGFGYVPAMLRGTVQATFGGFWSYDATALMLVHRHPQVIRVSQGGVPAYNELVLVVPQREAARDGEDLRAFLHALTRGQQEVKANPVAAAALLVKANPGLDPRLELQSLERTLPLSYPTAANAPYGYQEPSAWEAFARWMYGQRLLHTSPATLAPPFTNEFLPGQGP
jgi:putative hydroxymethylpyrimidine transport system substrate-binding protein